MKQDKETKKALLASARQEFMEKGYTNASLRSICKNAGVTTGALYFFFENKEALFNELTDAAVSGLYQIMLKHYEDEKNLDEKDIIGIIAQSDFSEDMEAMGSVIHHMYQYRQDILLVLTKSQGTKYENIVDEFIELTERHLQMIAEKIQRAYGGTVISKPIVHWVSHMQIDAFVYVITHIEKEEDALLYMEQMVKFMINGWYAMINKK